MLIVFPTVVLKILLLLVVITTVTVVSGRVYDGGRIATLLLPGGVPADVDCVSYCSFEDSAIASCDYNCNRCFRSCVRL